MGVLSGSQDLGVIYQSGYKPADDQIVELDLSPVVEVWIKNPENNLPLRRLNFGRPRIDFRERVSPGKINAKLIVTQIWEHYPAAVPSNQMRLTNGKVGVKVEIYNSVSSSFQEIEFTEVDLDISGNLVDFTFSQEVDEAQMISNVLDYHKHAPGRHHLTKVSVTPYGSWS